MSVAIHASRRANIEKGSSTIVFGAGPVGMLCAAMAIFRGSTEVLIADVQKERVEFAIEHGFAHFGFVVSPNNGPDQDVRLQMAKNTATQLTKRDTRNGKLLGKVDTVFECTGTEACTQSAIYVSSCSSRSRFKIC